jgi:nucleotidyltransferase substrate binding protein (TIGR01987 family)
MSLNTTHFEKYILTLESSLEHLNKSTPDSIEYEVFRNATIKGFELVLETAGKLLRKTLKLYTSNPQSIDEMTFKEVLRHAAKHSLLNAEAVTRWFKYRHNRNNTAHDYGISFATETVMLLSNFLKDAYALKKTLQKKMESKDA